jgi:hypothetical protein
MRLVAGNGHQAACHYSEDLVEVSVDSLRADVDVEADEELADDELVEEEVQP